MKNYYRGALGRTQRRKETDTNNVGEKFISSANLNDNFWRSKFCQIFCGCHFDDNTIKKREKKKNVSDYRVSKCPLSRYTRICVYVCH